jgi:hypothetical protein
MLGVVMNRPLSGIDDRHRLTGKICAANKPVEHIFNDPGMPWAYSGDEISNPSQLAPRSRRSATMVGSDS